jgi:hypothetical protein
VLDRPSLSTSRLLRYVLILLPFSNCRLSIGRCAFYNQKPSRVPAGDSRWCQVPRLALARFANWRCVAHRWSSRVLGAARLSPPFQGCGPGMLGHHLPVSDLKSSQNCTPASLPLEVPIGPGAVYRQSQLFSSPSIT